MISQKLILGHLFYGTLCIILFIVFGAEFLLHFITTLLFYIILLGGIQKIWFIFRKKAKKPWYDFYIHFLYASSGMLSIFFLLFGSFLLVQNEIAPAKMQLYTLTNGSKTLQFQTMSHIASEKFYNQVRENIRKAKKEGYVLFYEGVKTGTPENEAQFNKALGVKFDTELYDNFSKVYGVVAQDNNTLLNIGNNNDYNVDLNLDEIMDLYRKKVNSQENTTSSSEELQDINKTLLGTLSQLDERQLLVLQYINTALLNFIMKHEDFRNIIIEKLGNPDIFHVILYERNQNLVQAIETSTQDKIFITYGLMHFQGVLELLQASDQKWRIEKTEEFPVL